MLDKDKINEETKSRISAKIPTEKEETLDYFYSNYDNLSNSWRKKFLDLILKLFGKDREMIKGITLLTKHIKVYREPKDFINVMSVFTPIFQTKESIERYLEYYIKETGNIKNIFYLFGDLLSTEFLSIYTLEDINEIYTNIVKKFNLEPEDFRQTIVKQSKKPILDNFKDFIDKLNHLIQNGDYNKAEIILYSIDCEIDIANKFYSLLVETSYKYILDKKERNLNKIKNTYGDLLSLKSWEFTFKNTNKFHFGNENSDILKAYRILTEKDDLYLEEPSESLDNHKISSESYKTLHTGNSDDSIEIKALKKELSHSFNKENIIKRLAPILIRVKNLEELESLFNDYGDYIKDKKWLAAQKFIIYRRNKNDKDILEFIKKNIEFLELNKKSLYSETVYYIFLKSMKLYSFDSALKSLFFINENKVYNQRKFIKEILRLDHYIKDQYIINRFLDVIKDTYSAEEINKLLEDILAEERAFLRDIDHVLSILKIYQELGQIEQCLFLIDLAISNNPSKEYLLLLKNIKNNLGLDYTKREDDEVLDIENIKFHVRMLIASEKFNELNFFARFIKEKYSRDEYIQELISRITNNPIIKRGKEINFLKGNAIVLLLRDHENAVKFFEQSLITETNKERTVKVLLQSYISMGRYEDALLMLKGNSRIINDKKWLDSSLIIVYEKLEKYEKTLKLLKHQLREATGKNERKNLYGQIARIYLSTNRPNKALTYAEKILEFDDLDSIGARTKINALLNMGQKYILDKWIKALELRHTKNEIDRLKEIINETHKSIFTEKHEKYRELMGLFKEEKLSEINQFIHEKRKKHNKNHVRRISPNYVNNLFLDYSQNGLQYDGIIQFFDLIIKNPDFSFLWRKLGDLFLEINLIREANTAYYKSALIANAITNWKMYIAFCTRKNLVLSKISGLMHAYLLDQKNLQIQDEIMINIKKAIFKLSVEQGNVKLISRILKLYDDNLGSFHNCDSKTRKHLVSFVRLMKGRFKEAILMIEDDLDFNEKLRLSYYLLGVGEYDLAKENFERLLSMDFDGFARNGIELYTVLQTKYKLPQEFFHLIEYLPKVPSIEAIKEFGDFIVKTGKLKEGLEAFKWLIKAFDNDLIMRRELGKLLELSDDIEGAYHFNHQTFKLGKHPNDFIEDSKNLILYCFQHNMETRAQNIVKETLNLDDKVIIATKNDTRIRDLKEYVSFLNNSLNEIDRKINSINSTEMDSLFSNFIQILRHKDIDEAINFIDEVENNEFLEDGIALNVLLRHFGKKSILVKSLYKYFTKPQDLLSELNKKPQYINLLLSSDGRIKNIIIQIHKALEESHITQEEITRLLQNTSSKNYKKVLNEALENNRKTMRNIVVDLGRILFNDSFVAVSISQFIRSNKLSQEEKLELLILCNEISSNDYYLINIGNIYFKSRRWKKAENYYSQLTLDHPEHGERNAVFLFLSQLLYKVNHLDKSDEKTLSISDKNFLQLNWICTHLLRDENTKPYIKSIKAYLEKNISILYTILLFTEYRISYQWESALSFLKENALILGPFYEKALLYLRDQVEKHSGPKETEILINSEIVRMKWSKNPIEQSIGEENQKNNKEKNHFEEFERVYFDEKKIDSLSKPNRQESLEGINKDSLQDLSTRNSNYKETMNESNEFKKNLEDFKEDFPIIWGVFSRYELDDNRKKDKKLLDELINEASSMNINKSFLEDSWLAVAKVAYMLKETNVFLDALIKYGAHKVHNLKKAADYKKTREYILETLKISKYKTKDIINDSNVVKPMLGIMLTSMVHVQDVETLIKEKEIYKWLSENINLEESSIKLKKGIEEILFLITKIEDFYKIKTIAEKNRLFNSIIKKVTNLNKVKTARRKWDRSFSAISRNWKVLLKSLENELYPIPNIQLYVPNDEIRRKDELFIELTNNGEGSARNIEITIQDLEEGSVLGDKKQLLENIFPNQSRAISIPLEFPKDCEVELSFLITYYDDKGSTTSDKFDYIINVHNEKTFEEIPNRYNLQTVVRAKDFYGRKEVIKKISNNITGDIYDKVIVLHGLRRVGKTSILYYLNNELYGAKDSNIIPIMIDIQKFVQTRNTQGFVYKALVEPTVQTLSRVLEEKINMPNIDTFEDTPMLNFDSFLNDLESKLNGKKILYLLDEFEGLIDGINEQRYDQYILDALRNIMQHRSDTRFILVGADKLVEMLQDYMSTIFSMSLNIPISFLDKKSARKMIIEMAPEVIYTDNAITKLLELTSGHPFYTKIICSSLIQHLNEKKRNTVYLLDVDKVNKSIVTQPQHSQYFNYIWDMLNSLEKLLISYIANELKFSKDKVDLSRIVDYFGNYREITGEMIIKALEKLATRDILKEYKNADEDKKGTKYKFSIDLYRKWFRYNKSLSKTEVEVRDFVNL